MSVKLNHLIVLSHDKTLAANFFTRILSLPNASAATPFLTVVLDNEITLDFLEAGHDVVPQHYAFLVDENKFQEIFSRLQNENLPCWADPFHTQPNTVGVVGRSRHIYFNDPSGHNLEVLMF